MDEWVKTLYKSNRGFGKNFAENRRENMVERRRNQRMSQLDERRNMNFTPSPGKVQNSVAEKVKPAAKPKNNRLELLKKWKEEKEKKKKEEKMKQKPLFRLCGVVEHKDIYSSGATLKPYAKNKSTLDLTSRNPQQATTKKSIPSLALSKPPSKAIKRTNSIQSLPGSSGISKQRLQPNLRSKTSTVSTQNSNKIPKSNTTNLLAIPSTSGRFAKPAETRNKSKTTPRVTKNRVSIIAENTQENNISQAETAKNLSVTKNCTPKTRLISARKSSSRSSTRSRVLETSTPYNSSKIPSVTTTDESCDGEVSNDPNLKSTQKSLSRSSRRSQTLQSSTIHDSVEIQSSNEEVPEISIPSKSKKDLEVILIIEKPNRRRSSFLNASGVVQVTTPKEENGVKLRKSGRRSSKLVQNNENVNEVSMTKKTPRKSDVSMRNKTPGRNDNSSVKPRSLRKTSSYGSTESTAYLTANETSSDNLENVFSTPNPRANNDTVYVSPFVTTSRGKSEARREYQQRKSMEAGNTSLGFIDDAQSPKAAANYFTRILDTEIATIQEKCREWEELKNTGTLSDDACGSIDIAIGQSNLLITKKLKQFRGLIEKCRRQDASEMIIRCEDLHGFWDMVYNQVINLNKRFENLEEMKRNNWLEVAPEQTKTKKDNVKKRKRKPTSNSGSSLLKDAIAAARKKMPKRHNSNVEVCILSGKSDLMNTETEIATPGRGILKSHNTRSEKRKTVAFKDFRASLPDDKENETKSAKKSTPHQPMRRSLRLNLSATKLDFN